MSVLQSFSFQYYRFPELVLFHCRFASRRCVSFRFVCFVSFHYVEIVSFRFSFCLCFVVSFRFVSFCFFRFVLFCFGFSLHVFCLYRLYWPPNDKGHREGTPSSPDGNKNKKPFEMQTNSYSIVMFENRLHLFSLLPLSLSVFQSFSPSVFHPLNLSVFQTSSVFHSLSFSIFQSFNMSILQSFSFAVLSIFRIGSVSFYFASLRCVSFRFVCFVSFQYVRIVLFRFLSCFCFLFVSFRFVLFWFFVARLLFVSASSHRGPIPPGPHPTGAPSQTLTMQTITNNCAFTG